MVDNDPLAELELLENEQLAASAVLEAGGPVPEPGFELPDPKGRPLAEACLAWPQLKVAMLLDRDSEDGKTFQADGWQVFSEDQVQDLVTAVLAATQD